MGFSGGAKNPPANAGDARDAGLTLGQEDPLEKEMATNSSKTMLLKCCTQYASKFGKLSSDYRTGKG